MANLCADRYTRYAGLTPAFTMSYSTNNGGAIIAPLYVHCDATATVSTAVAEAFGNLWYKFEVVEGGSWGNWSYGRQMAKNVCYGPIAGFLIPSDGTYTIRLTVFDGYAQRSTEQSITVTSADAHYAGGATICINVNGDSDFSAKPSGATEVNLSAANDFDAAIATHVANNTRVLFKGGSTFNASTDGTITETNVTVGSYGTGRAIVSCTAGAGVINPSGSTNLRVLDLECNANANASASILQTNPASALTGLTVSNCYTHGGGRGIYIHGTGSAGLAQSPVLVGVFGCIVSDTSYSCFWMGQKVCIIGSSFNSNFAGAGSHTMRMKYGQRFNVSNCDLRDPIAGGAGFKCTAPDRNGAGWDTTDNSKTKLGVVSDNYFQGSTTYELHIGPQTTAQDGTCEDIIDERNMYDATTGNGSFVVLGATRIISRNNIGRLLGGADTRFAMVERNSNNSAPAPVPSGVNVLNWSVYSSRSDVSAHTFAYVNSGDATVFKNHAIHAPSLDGTLTVLDNSGTNTVTGSNASAAQITGATSPFANATPSTAAQFAAANWALAAGDPAVPVFDDYTGALRYKGNKAPVIDLGAVQTS